MRTRQLISLAVIVIGATTFLWYAALAPSRGSSIQPGYSEVIATAAVTGNGSWVRYLVTVNNLGSLDFEGDVLLADRLDPGSLTGRAANLPSLYGSPMWGSPIGQAKFTAAAPDAAYQAHIRIPRHQHRVVPILAPEGYSVVQVLNAKKQLIEMASVENAGGISVAFLGDEETAAAIQAVRFDDFAVKVTDYTTADLVPASSLGLAPFTEVIIGRFRTDLLSQAQLGALRDYVGLGGSLILAGGETWRTSLLPLPTDLLPMRPASSATGSVQAIASMVGRADDAVVPLATGALRAGSRVAVAAPGGPPLIVESSYGSGRIVQLTFDPSAEQLRAAKIGALAWSQAVGRGLERVPGVLPGARSAPGPAPIETTLFPPSLDPPPVAAWLVGVGFLAYLLVIGPATFLVLRQRRRPELMLVAVPAIALLTAGSVYAAGSALRGGTRAHEVHVMKVGAGGVVDDLTYTRVFFQQRGDHQVELAEGGLVAPMTLDISLHTQAGCDRCLLQFAGQQNSAHEHVVMTRRPQVEETGVAFGTARVIATVSTSHQPMGFDAHLSSSGKQVSGTITNLGSSPIRSAALYVFDEDGYQRIALADVLPPGVTVNVQGAPFPLPGSLDVPLGGSSLTARPGAGDPVASAVAHAALIRDPKPVLVGFVDLPPSRIRIDGAVPARSGVALLEQPVRLELTDRLAWSSTTKRTVALSGDVRSGFVDTYELQVPAIGASNLVLGTDAPTYAGLEVYDWSTGTWGVTAWRQDPAVAARHQAQLSRDQVQDGVVRVRMHEPRPSWAGGISITVAT